MYPFERFTDAAKGALTLAQEEAERSHKGYIGCEHLLLGLVRQRETVACEALRRLGLAYPTLRQRIQTIVGGNERLIIQQIIPTSRVKRVVELSFGEARRSGFATVGTDHLLIGLVLEGDGVAADVLRQAGATLVRVHEMVARVRQNGVDELASGYRASDHPVSAADTSWARHVLSMAGAEAAADVDDAVTDAHLLRALLVRGDESVVHALRRLGLEPTQLAAALRPPEDVVSLRRSVREIVNEQQAAAARADHEAAAAARMLEQKLRGELEAAERVWRADR